MAARATDVPLEVWELVVRPGGQTDPLPAASALRLTCRALRDLPPSPRPCLLCCGTAGAALPRSSAAAAGHTACLARKGGDVLRRAEACVALLRNRAELGLSRLGLRLTGRGRLRTRLAHFCLDIAWALRDARLGYRLRLQEGEELLAAARWGEADTIRRLRSGGVLPAGGEIRVAAAHGQADAVRALRRIGCRWEDEPSDGCSQYLPRVVGERGHLSVGALAVLHAHATGDRRIIDCLFEEKYNWGRKRRLVFAICAAAACGDPGLFDMLWEVPTTDWVDPVTVLGCSGSREVAAHIYGRLCPAERDKIARHAAARAAGNGLTGVALYLCELAGAQVSGAMLFEAVAGGQTETVRELCRGRDDLAGQEWSLCTLAVAGGHVDLLRVLRNELGCPWDGGEYDAAIRSPPEAHAPRLLAVLREELRCPWPKVLCSLAVARGDVRILRVLRNELGCPWDGNEYCTVVRVHPEVDGLFLLAVLHDELGCPWSGRELQMAAAMPFDTRDLAAMMREMGCPAN